MDIKQTNGLNSSVYTDSLEIRKVVFIEEQAVDKTVELDGIDDQCLHYTGYVNESPVCTLRLQFIDDKTCKVQRVATLKKERGQGYARQLMKRIAEDMKEKGITELKLSAQVPVIPYYEKLGYQTYGEEFSQADRPHQMMVKSLT